MPKQTPLEKANQLIDLFYDRIEIVNPDLSECIQCALITVQEVIDSEPKEQETYEFFVAVQAELNKMYNG